MTTKETKLWHCIRRHERCEFLNAVGERKTRRGRFEAEMCHFGHPLFEDGPVLEPSDGGKGAEAIRARVWTSTPLWERLWTNAYSKLPPKGKKILNALAVDWRSRPAARIAGVSQPTVDSWKTFFKMHFAQCYQAWKRDLGT